jgi:hypothetical protein
MLASYVAYAVALCSCSLSLSSGRNDEEKARAVAAIELFHSRLKAGQFERIYTDASAALRESTPRATVIAYLEHAHRRFGAFKVLTHSEFNVLVGVPVQVRGVCNSRYEQGDATELFIFLKEDDKVRLLAYQIYPGTVVPAKQDSKK